MPTNNVSIVYYIAGMASSYSNQLIKAVTCQSQSTIGRLFITSYLTSGVNPHNCKVMTKNNI
ncbi:MAG: hypothetical protein RLZZ419_1472 [Pseudomonadota bacterium]|jgi:hypothetical protein